ncbi:hypothetical protein SO802_030915 [Lithocarpus litseifolius]|uniref:Uncharacterized protein n=1 Tax=Lithocarpus litseifolius TaxID=425828 RepID=A0AAW2BM20_9ROSI
MEGKWRIGNGYNIPLNHKDWFPDPNLSVHQPHLPISTVGDLIDHERMPAKLDIFKLTQDGGGPFGK